MFFFWDFLYDLLLFSLIFKQNFSVDLCNAFHTWHKPLWPSWRCCNSLHGQGILQLDTTVFGCTGCRYTCWRCSPTSSSTCNFEKENLNVSVVPILTLCSLYFQAMMTFSENADKHITMTLKGLVASLGVLFFFLFERLLTMIAEWRKEIEKKEKPSSRVRVMRDPELTGKQKLGASGKECKHKYSSYPYCYDEIAKDTKDDHHHHKNGQSPIDPNQIHRHQQQVAQQVAQEYFEQNNYSLADGYVALTAAKEDCHHVDSGSALVENGSNETKDKSTMKEESYTIILREHESKHHGHSHAHGHVHSPPRSMSAVAWMVIMGDGLHNFTDGMAIGAAFSNNIAGGFSTAIAVFCHELPHELVSFLMQWFFSSW